ncbi:MAG: rhodanese-like domain-containing protein [Eubacteriales bacterium]|nr:rhodanese-like domain-containing protein [Eubacteriales bacterium]
MKRLKIITAILAVLLLFVFSVFQAACKTETTVEDESAATDEESAEAERLKEENRESEDESMELIEKEIVIMGKVDEGYLVYVLPEAEDFHGLAIFNKDAEKQDELDFGKIYKIEFNGAMTRSIPPQFAGNTVKESDRQAEVLNCTFNDYMIFTSFMGEQQLLDVRTDSEYQTGHLENSINHSLGKIEEGDFGNFSKERPLFLYCRSGARSGEAGYFYLEEGFPVVVNMGGVIDFPQDKLLK